MIYFNAFFVGGLICVIGQILIDYTKLTPARILVLFVVLGCILGAFNLYQPLIDYAGAGATVPLTGFGNLLAEGVREQIQSKGLIGVISGGMTKTSAGITTAIVVGFLVALVSKSKAKD